MKKKKQKIVFYPEHPRKKNTGCYPFFPVWLISFFILMMYFFFICYIGFFLVVVVVNVAICTHREIQNSAKNRNFFFWFQQH